MTWHTAPGDEPREPPWRRWLTMPPPAARLPWLSSGAVLLIQLAGSHFAAENQPDRVALDTAGRALLAAGPLLLLLRYRYPRLTAFATTAAVLAYLAAGYPYGPVFLSAIAGCAAAVLTGHRRSAWTAMGVLWTGLLLTGHWLYRWLPPGGDTPASWQDDAGNAAWAAAALAGAELLRVRREQRERERRARAEAERRRADEERLRIARELHDVLAHSMSVINVQAGVGLALLDSDPDQARTALTTIKAASREALGEVRQVLDALRTPGAAPRAPAPGLRQLPELADQAARAGLHVETETLGEPSPLPPGADLAAFRIIQEALTNTVRHSAARTARVRLHYTGGHLGIRVDDDGPAAGGTTGGGNGLIGMRERAAACGGTVTAGPRPGGGFRVTARLPLTTPRENP